MEDYISKCGNYIGIEKDSGPAEDGTGNFRPVFMFKVGRRKNNIVIVRGQRNNSGPQRNIDLFTLIC